jgi:exosortase/archaeosortase family protein
LTEEPKAGEAPLRRFFVQNRSILLRSLIYLVAVVVGSNLILLDWFDGTVGAFMREQIADAAASVISALGFKARALGENVYLSRSSVQIVNSCTGVDVSIFLASAILVFPAPWRSKLWGVLLSIFIVVGLNFLRVVTLCFFVDSDRELFEFTHYYIWPGFIILACLAILLIWIQSLGLEDEA